MALRYCFQELMQHLNVAAVIYENMSSEIVTDKFFSFVKGKKKKKTKMEKYST